MPTTDPFAPAPKGFKPRYKRGETVDRFWKHKQTGVKVEVVRYMLVDNAYFQVVFMDPDIGCQLSMRKDDFVKEYEPMGNAPFRGVLRRKPGGK